MKATTMKATTRSGLKITHAPFWLVWRGPGDGGPERFPHLLVHRPLSSKAEPLSCEEALGYWLHSCVNHCTASPEAEDYLITLRDY
jgi:hypothetical protein